MDKIHTFLNVEKFNKIKLVIAIDEYIHLNIFYDEIIDIFIKKIHNIDFFDDIVIINNYIFILLYNNVDEIGLSPDYLYNFYKLNGKYDAYDDCVIFNWNYQKLCIKERNREINNILLNQVINKQKSTSPIKNLTLDALTMILKEAKTLKK